MKTKFFTMIVLLALALSVFVPSKASLAQSENVCPIGLVKIEVTEYGTFVEYGEAEIPEGFTYYIDGPTVTFSQPVNICVKAGDNYEMIFGVTEYTVDWTNPGGQTPDISHIVIYEFLEEYEGQWCSPGYWRQEHHLDAWAATGYSPEDLYPGTEYTLWEILQDPTTFARLGLFEAVGDLLSGAHPDVDFLGVRVEDSCPLD